MTLSGQPSPITNAYFQPSPIFETRTSPSPCNTKTALKTHNAHPPRQRLTPNGSIESAPESGLRPTLTSSAGTLPRENLRLPGPVYSISSPEYQINNSLTSTRQTTPAGHFLAFHPISRIPSSRIAFPADRRTPSI